MHLALRQLAEAEGELAEVRPRRPEQEDVLPELLLLHQPLKRFEFGFRVDPLDTTRRTRPRHELRHQWVRERPHSVSDAHGGSGSACGLRADQGCIGTLRCEVWRQAGEAADAGQHRGSERSGSARHGDGVRGRVSLISKSTRCL